MYRSSLVSPHWIWTWFHLIAPQNMEVSFILFLNNFQGFSQRSCYPRKPDNNIHIVHRCSLYSYFDNYLENLFDNPVLRRSVTISLIHMTFTIDSRIIM